MKKERPILFSTPMVQAILEGRKTQTRRIVKPQPKLFTDEPVKIEDETFWKPEYIGRFLWETEKGEFFDFSPYGKVGDILWVRETWHDGAFLGSDAGYIYKASENGQAWQQSDENWKWKPSIFMPRAACRILLEITDVRVERLQDISEEDAITEGAPHDRYLGKGVIGGSHREGFIKLWGKINGEESWNSNPWVWVISFNRINY